MQLFQGNSNDFLGPSVVPFYPFLGEGSPTKIDHRKKGTLILTSLLEDLASAQIFLLLVQRATTFPESSSQIEAFAVKTSPMEGSTSMLAVWMFEDLGMGQN